MSDFVLSVRGRSGTGYNNRLAGAKYLKMPEGAAPHKDHELSFTRWGAALRDEAGCGTDKKGNILFFVHGFNTEVFELMERHGKIRDGLRAQGYDGAIVSFDWPSNGHVLGYVNDRLDARAAANTLMEDGIRPFAKAQTPDCDVNVHVLAHSMGCFLTRECFDYADDDPTSAQSSWMISQVAMVAADISRRSMREGSSNARSLIRRSTRVTNYYSRHDQVLSISEVKRVGVSRRLGRVGAPDDRSEKVVNLDCSDLYQSIPAHHGCTESHRWYFDEPQFYADLCATLISNLDREVIPNRTRSADGLKIG
jgi:esterase/lipase superfamily enzyme